MSVSSSEHHFCWLHLWACQISFEVRRGEKKLFSFNQMRILSCDTRKCVWTSVENSVKRAIFHFRVFCVIKIKNHFSCDAGPKQKQQHSTSVMDLCTDNLTTNVFGWISHFESIDTRRPRMVMVAHYSCCSRPQKNHTYLSAVRSNTATYMITTYSRTHTTYILSDVCLHSATQTQWIKRERNRRIALTESIKMKNRWVMSNYNIIINARRCLGKNHT